MPSDIQHRHQSVIGAVDYSQFLFYFCFIMLRYLIAQLCRIYITIIALGLHRQASIIFAKFVCYTGVLYLSLAVTWPLTLPVYLRAIYFLRLRHGDPIQATMSYFSCLETCICGWSWSHHECRLA
ncbi:hypothetical protein V1524DRAFT_135194 [Lipomyces starkeyi]